MNSIKISIIVPVYNGESTIKRCIDSIINQTYKNIEIIIVNDGSIDNTKSICNEFERKYDFIKVINKKNQGVSEARNTGIDYSNGDYIIFVDGDDTINNNMCELLLSGISKERNLMPICGMRLIDENDNLIKSLKFNGISGEDIDRNNISKENYLLIFKYELLNSPCNKLFFSEIIKSKDIRFDSELALGEDLIFVMDYIKYIDGFYIINEELYNYIKTANESLSIKVYRDMYDIQMKIFDKLLNPIVMSKYNDIDLGLIRDVYYTTVWRSIRNLLRKSDEIGINFKIKEFIKILLDSKQMNLYNNKIEKRVNFYNIGTPFWYVKNKINGNI